MPKDDDHLLVPLERAHLSSQRKWHMLGFRKAILVAMAGFALTGRDEQPTQPDTVSGSRQVTSARPTS